MSVASGTATTADLTALYDATYNLVGMLQPIKQGDGFGGATPSTGRFTAAQIDTQITAVSAAATALAGNAPQLYNLAYLESYRTAGTPGQAGGTYVVPFPCEGGVPAQWAGEPALGGGSFITELTIIHPGGAAPAGGFTAVIFGTPTTGNDYMAFVAPTATYGPAWTAVQQSGRVAINARVRHPSTTLSANPSPAAAWWDDWAYAVQFVKALRQALNINPSKIDAIVRSRGSDIMRMALEADMADPNASTIERRQSTAIRSVHARQCQITLRPDQTIEEFIQASDWATAKAANPTDPRLVTENRKNVLELIATTSSQTKFFIDVDAGWWGAPVSYATFGASDQLHIGDATRRFRERMMAAGKGKQVAVNHSVPVGDITTILRWLDALDQVPTGDTPSAACLAAIAVAKANGENLYFMGTGHDVTGCSATVGTYSPITQGGKLAAMIDAADGLANRKLTGGYTGAVAYNVTASTQPVIADVAGNWVMQFPTNGILTVDTASDNTRTGWAATTTGWVASMRGGTATKYNIGADGILAYMLVGKGKGAITAANQRVYQQFGMELSGQTYTFA